MSRNQWFVHRSHGAIKTVPHTSSRSWRLSTTATASYAASRTAIQTNRGVCAIVVTRNVSVPSGFAVKTLNPNYLLLFVAQRCRYRVVQAFVYSTKTRCASFPRRNWRVQEAWKNVTRFLQMQTPACPEAPVIVRQAAKTAGSWCSSRHSSRWREFS